MSTGKWMQYEHGTLAEWYWQDKNDVITEKLVPRATVMTNPTWTALGLNSCFYSDRVINSLSHGRATRRGVTGFFCDLSIITESWVNIWKLQFLWFYEVVSQTYVAITSPSTQHVEVTSLVITRSWVNSITLY